MVVKIKVSMSAVDGVEVATLGEALEIVQSETYFRAIGEFIFRFSQLEFLLKSTLASYLKLKDDQFDVIVGPYDFAMLCTVAEKTIKPDFDEEHHKAISSLFNRCRRLNQEVRVVVAHARWSSGGARYASRQTLDAKMHFQSPDKLVKAAADATRLMDEFSQLGAVANS